jgi:ATP-dependent Lon protease
MATTPDEQALKILPLLPLRDVVIFPHMVVPLFVGRDESIRALDSALESDKRIFLVAQKDPEVDDPETDDLYTFGTIATILQLLRLPDGTVKVLIEGGERAQLIRAFDEDDHYWSEVSVVHSQAHPEEASDPQLSVIRKRVLDQFDRLIQVSKKMPAELLNSLSSIDEIGRLADSVASHMTFKIASRQAVLEELDEAVRIELLHDLLASELDLFEIEQRVQGRVKKQVEKSQRQYYLNEKIKVLQQELGDISDEGVPVDEIEKLTEAIEAAGMPEEALEKARSELNKLKMMPPMSAEATVSRHYLDIMLSVPWEQKTTQAVDLAAAADVLDRDHYGLEEVKTRILEYLAVYQRVSHLKGPILCLVGPPGVGKTSLGQSIAEAIGREFSRISLGGVRDESEIRGHRRTYIGAMPGKIIQRMIKAKVRNPLFMLDEIDKMGMDFRGDPASALLEVLDPEQNSTFNDHYLEVDYDLSDVMFIATANSMNIPSALRDRMEIIRLPGYTEHEKCNIAKRYLLPRQKKNAGLSSKEVSVTDGAMLDVIRYYTREAGVRDLDRHLSKICRKFVYNIAMKAKTKAKRVASQVTARNLQKHLGVKKFRFGVAEKIHQVGQVTGLAWTEVGGELLTIEAQAVPGKGKTLYTGQLGDVMKESIHIAMTVIRSRLELMGMTADYFKEKDLHMHVPEGATPKDGPSAGIGMCVAMISAVTGIPVRADVAMTGEITLRGEVLPIGGLKEKLLAAARGGIKTVLVPEDNAAELTEIPKEITDPLTIVPVRWIDAVLQHALSGMPAKSVSVFDEIALFQKQKEEVKDQAGSVTSH